MIKGGIADPPDVTPLSHAHILTRLKSKMPEVGELGAKVKENWRITDTYMVPDFKRYSELAQTQKRLLEAASDPRGKAFIGVLVRDGLRVSEAIQLKITDIDFERGTLTIVHLKERLKLKCPNCGDLLGKRHLFCPSCGEKVDQATREKVQQRRQRVIPIDADTLRLLDEYLKWRLQFPYRGPLVFPFTRQRGWQLIEKLGRRAGIKGLHPHFLRRLLATTWVAKGLDTKKLQVLLGHASIATTMEYVDSNFEKMKPWVSLN